MVTELATPASAGKRNAMELIHACYVVAEIVSLSVLTKGRDSDEVANRMAVFPRILPLFSLVRRWRPPTMLRLP